MSEFISSSISKLKFNINRGAKNAAGTLIKSGIVHIGNYLRGDSGTLIYRSRCAYKSRIIQAALTNSMQLLNATLTNAYPAYKRYLENNATKIAAQKNAATLLISHGEKSKDDGLYMDVKNSKGNARVYAFNKYGEQVNDALILGMPYGKNDKTPIEKTLTIGEQYKRVWDKTKNCYVRVVDSSKSRTIQSQSLVWFDLTPMVSLQSSKNLILTKVEGRDYSRKELVSGGDLNFSVKGKIVSGYPDIYPENEVKKFIQIMQYGGVVQVASPMFSVFNVTQIMIKDFQCDQTEGFKDTQPYSFSCVAVEPNEDVQATEDTINTVNLTTKESAKSGWIKTLLSAKLDDIKSSTARTTASTITSVMSSII